MGQLLISTAAAASLDFSSFIIAWVVRIHTDLLTFNTKTPQWYHYFYLGRKLKLVPEHNLYISCYYRV